MSKNFFLALSVIIGTAVGAGIFAIPYVVAKAGLLPTLFYFVVLGGAVLLIHLFFGEIVLRTKKKMRLIGYAEKYLGNWAKIFVTIAMFLGLTGTLLAYLIVGGEFLKILFEPIATRGILANSTYLSIIFWALLSFFIFRGIKLIAKAELWMNILFFLIIFLVLSFTLPNIELDSFVLTTGSDLFLPYGVILFAFSAWMAMPEISQLLKTKKERRNYKTIIVAAALLVFALYAIFALAVVGVSGEYTSEEALQGLVPFLGEKIIFLGALFGVLSIASSFLVLGNYFKNSLVYDYRLPKMSAAAIACCLPLLLFLIGMRSFINSIAFVGALIGVLEGVIIILIFKKIKKLGTRQPEYSLKVPSFVLYILIIIFILGAVTQFL